jgi:hypothetical protein
VAEEEEEEEEEGRGGMRGEALVLPPLAVKWDFFVEKRRLKNR